MTPNPYVPVRLAPTTIAVVDKIAAAEFEKNRSQTIRRLIELGLAAWESGARTPDQVGRTER